MYRLNLIDFTYVIVQNKFLILFSSSRFSGSENKENPYVQNILLKRAINQFIRIFSVLILLSIISIQSFSQDGKHIQTVSHFSGNISATNNGISPIPAFSLGKPAVIFEVSVGGDRLSFEPEIRFSMDWKPWAFIWWWRYKIISSERLNVRAGVTPSFIFREIASDINGTPVETMLVQRYLTGEIALGYTISKKIKVGVYYFHSLGLDQGSVRHTQFLTVNSSIDNIKLSDHFYFNVRPQIIYLKSGERDGYFTTTSVILGKRKFPLSIGSFVNKKIKSEIQGTKDWVWNISLIYSFNNRFVRQ